MTSCRDIGGTTDESRHAALAALDVTSRTIQWVELRPCSKDRTLVTSELSGTSVKH